MNRLIKKLDIDIIHSQHPNLLGRTARKWAKKKKIPLIFTWHTLYDQYVNFVPFLPKKISIWYIIKKAASYANQASAVIMPTDSIVPFLKKWGVRNKNIISIATGVNEADFADPHGEAIREKYKIKKEEKVLLLASRLTAEKNVAFIFQALKDILREDRAKLLVVGGGYLQPKLEEFCRKEDLSGRVIFCGEVAREEMKNYYAAGDIFVYGSKSETQGMVITEAMYAGLPIVAINATGINSLVLNNGNGFLLNSEKEFSAAVANLVKDRNLREKFGETSARIAKMKFTAAICAEKMLEVYEKTIQKSDPRGQKSAV